MARLSRPQIAQALGLLAAVFLAIVVNVLAARHYRRWDATSGKRYTLSPATLATLHGLSDKVEIWVLLGSGDPLEQSVKQLLVSYQAETSKLEIHPIDPDRDAVQLVDVQQRFKIEAGRTEAGRVVTDAVMVVARGDRHWFITADDLFEAQAGDTLKARPREEQAITAAIRAVLAGEKSELCFTVGHGELSLEPAREGWIGELRSLLEKDNYGLRAVDLSGAGKPLAGCAALVIAGPLAPFTKEEDEAVRDYLAAGGSALFAVGPVPGSASDTGMTPAGLEASLSPFGIGLVDVLVIDPDPQVALPGGRGAEFFATAKGHAVSHALVPEGNTRNPPRVTVFLARALRRTGGDAEVSELLASSEKSYGVRTMKGIARGTEPPASRAGDPAGPFMLAMASERPKAAGAARGARVVVLGSRYFLAEDTFRQPRPVRGAAFLVEGALSWLTVRPVVLDVPDRPSVAAGIRITEESRTEVRNYVLLWMPLGAALLGLAIFLRRRSTEGAPRKDGPREGKRPKRGERAA